MADGSIAERNIARLVGSHEPIEMTPRFRQRLRSTLVLDQRRVQRQRRLVRTAAMLSIATLLAVWAIASSVSTSEVWRVELTAAESRSAWFTQTEGEDGWTRRTGNLSLSKPTEVASGSGGGITVRRPSTRLSLTSDTVVAVTNDTTRARMHRGSVGVETSDLFTLETPLANLHGSQARYDVTIQMASPLPSLEQEYEMNRTLTTGAIVGVAILVAIAVWPDSDPVTLETENGETHSVEGGQTATVDRQGRVSIGSGSVAGGRGPQTRSENDTVPSGESALPSSTRSLSGQVVDVQGAPIPGARVSFEQIGTDPAEANRTVAHAVTDEDGNFALEVARDIDRGVLATSLEHFETDRLDWLSPEAEVAAADPDADSHPTDAGADSDPTDLAESDSAEAESIVITLTTSTGFAGRVIDRDSGEPLEKYLLGYQRYLDAYRRMEPKVLELETEDGTYHVSSMTPGLYRVWVYQEGRVVSPERRIELAPGQLLRDVDFELAPGVTLTANVFAKKSGRPIANAVVYPHTDHLMGSVDILGRVDVDARVRHAGRTDTKGRVVLEDLRPKRTLVRVLHPDYMPEDLWVNWDPTDPETKSIDVGLAEGFGFRGKVLGGDGQPIPGAQVIAITMSLNPDTSQLSWATVDETGEYYVENLKPGPYILVRILPDDTNGTDSRVNNSFLSASADVVVDFVDQPSLATVKGRVVDSDGNPSPLAAVSLVRMETKDARFKLESAAADADGYYEVKNVEFGEYTVSIAPSFGQNFAVVGILRCEESIDYTFDITIAEFSLSGGVTDPKGEAVHGCEVIVLRSNPGTGGTDFAGRSVTDADGSYRVPALGEGEYRVMVRSAGYRPSVSDVVTLADDAKRSAEIDVVLEPGATLDVNVLDATGAPMVGVRVEILAENGQRVNQGMGMETDASGNFSFASLDPGSYQVRIAPDGHEPMTQRVEAKVGVTTPVRFQLPQ